MSYTQQTGANPEEIKRILSRSPSPESWYGKNKTIGKPTALHHDMKQYYAHHRYKSIPLKQRILPIKSNLIQQHLY